MKRLFFIRKDLGMSPGKLAVMVGHGSELYWMNLIKKHSETIPGPLGSVIRVNTLMFNENLLSDYIDKDYTKIVLAVKSLVGLNNLAKKLTEMGLVENEGFGFIIDKCYYETKPENENGTTTVGIWVAPLDDETCAHISKKYRLYGSDDKGTQSRSKYLGS